MPPRHEERPAVENRILAVLPAEDSKRLLQHSKQVKLEIGTVVIAPEDPIHFVYFPVGALVSLVSLTEEGKAAEAGTIGREGMAGLPVLLGGGTTPMRSMVQIEGGAVQVRAGEAKAEFDRGGAFQDTMHGYMHALFVAFSQASACNRLHSIEDRLARWLLLTSDGVQSESFRLTHEYLSIMLGIRRAGVTEACIVLKDKGLIDYHRGHMRITDREGLEGLSCECYAVVKKEFDRVLGGS